MVSMVATGLIACAISVASGVGRFRPSSLTAAEATRRRHSCRQERGTSEPKIAIRFAGIAKILGDQIQQWGNDVHIVSVTRNGNLSSHLIAFPVKHNWWEKADLELIRKSADALHKWTRDPEFKRMKFVLVRAGCGNGGLRWEDVQPILSNLPDCVLVIHPERVLESHMNN